MSLQSTDCYIVNSGSDRGILYWEDKVLYEDSLNLNSVNQLIFVMVRCGVLFEVWTGFLNNI
jgi:hypothetical protein